MLGNGRMFKQRAQDYRIVTPNKTGREPSCGMSSIIIQAAPAEQCRWSIEPRAMREATVRRRIKRWLITMTWIVSVMFGLFFVGRFYYASVYPYGMSHCCDLNMMFALEEYARQHDGAYPAGEATPEASLGLLYPNFIDAYTLRGKSVPEEVVQTVFDRGERLGPDTCGWHYVAGLRADDDPKLAIFWDKAGLDHNGRRLSQGDHVVMFLKFRRQLIPAQDWPGFLTEQQKLFEEAQLKRAKAE